MESKQAEEAAGALKDKKKKIKKTKDKAAEKREKEKKKREKEKELIKKKLKAAKDYKDKKKSGGGGGNLDAPIQAAAVVKKGDPKNLKTGKVIPTGDVEKDFMFDEEKGESKASYPKAKGGGKALEMGLSKKTGKVLPDGPAGPGELLAAKNTEAGFKQRKVNKRMKDYEEVEEKDDGGGKGKKDS